MDRVHPAVGGALVPEPWMQEPVLGSHVSVCVGHGILALGREVRARAGSWQPGQRVLDMVLQL